jgi:hypothetical protein
MTLETRKCKLCDYEVTKNGRWNAKYAIEEHLQTEHPKELAANNAHNLYIDEEIQKLANQKKLLWIPVYPAKKSARV